MQNHFDQLNKLRINRSENISIQSKKHSIEKIFKFLSKEFRCTIRFETDVVLFKILFFIFDVSIWRMKELFCEIFNEDVKIIIGFNEKIIWRTENLVRLIFIIDDDTILIEKHDEVCDVNQILFIEKFKTSKNRFKKINKFLDQEIYNLQKY